MLEQLDRQIGIETQIAGVALMMGSDDVRMPDAAQRRRDFDALLNADPVIEERDPKRDAVLQAFGAKE